MNYEAKQTNPVSLVAFLAVVLAILTFFTLVLWGAFNAWIGLVVLFILLHNQPPNLFMRVTACFFFAFGASFEKNGISFLFETPITWILIASSLVCSLVAIVCRFSAKPSAWECSAFLLSGAFAAASVAGTGSTQFGATGMLDWFGSFGLNPDVAFAITVGLRKLVHLSFFGYMAAVSFLSFRKQSEYHFEILWILIFVLINASFDEYRQSLTTNRTGTIADVAIDLIGAGIAIWILHTWAKRKLHRHESSQPPPA